MSDASDAESAGLKSAGLVTVGQAMGEVWRIALPLMVSTGTFSLVLFADRTLLLKYDGASMSAAMAGGNLFWVLVCLPMGIASMTGAIVSQYVGAGQEKNVGRFLWQSIWMSFAFTPFFGLIAWQTPWLFEVTGQPEPLIPLGTVYLRVLMIGAVGNVLETALSGFYSGTERTNVIMWVSLAAGIINIALDVVLIFGVDLVPAVGISIPAMGIQGAAIASVVAFWFKVVCYGWLLMRPHFEKRYRFRSGFGFDFPMGANLLFFGFPTGLMYVTEAGGFTAMVLRIGTLGDVPLRATTMAINFNMIAFIPLIGVSIAASVLVGRHLTETGPQRATQSVYAAMAIGLIYSLGWMIAYLTIGDWMMSLYEFEGGGEDSLAAITLARGLLSFVALYVVLDAVQLILAGALRGAGDTWYVLLGGLTASTVALTVGYLFEPPTDGLRWWWSVIAGWVFLLAIVMGARFASGKWKSMRMVKSEGAAT